MPVSSYIMRFDDLLNRNLGHPDQDTGSSKMLSLRTLVKLRWIAIIGQCAAVLIVYFILGYAFPITACLCIILISVIVTFGIRWRWRPGLKLRPPILAFLLTLDVVELSALLYLTGGIANPFSLLLVLPSTISAATLPLGWTLLLELLTLGITTLLAFFHGPLPSPEGQPISLTASYVFGIWAAITCGILYSAFHARAIAKETRKMTTALTVAETALAHEQRFLALDGMAAAAAHELGTPLATISLVAKELKRELPKTSPHMEDIDLLISQAERCRTILAKLANREAQTDTSYDLVQLSAFLEDIIAPLREIDCPIILTIITNKTTPSPEPILQRNPAIAYGIANLVENGVDFAHSLVRITASWTVKTIDIIIEDDGPGFATEIINHLGEPYVTTRPGYDLKTPADLQQPTNADLQQHAGMGLGLFIAKTLLERSGALVHLANQKPPHHGARITIKWPRSQIEEPAESPAP